MSGTRDLINWEREDRARTFRESGYVSYEDDPTFFKGPFSISGPETALLVAILGDPPVRPARAPERRPHIFETKTCSRAKWIRSRKLEGWSLPSEAQVCDISYKQFTNLYSAVAFANRHNLQMNASLTVSWSQLGIPDEMVFASAFEAFVDRLREWHRHQQTKQAWIYTNERSKNIGLHTHMMLSIPNDRLPAFSKWCKETFKGKLKRADSNLVAAKIKSIYNLEGQWNAFQYLCKGVSQYTRVVPACRSIDGLPIFLGDLVRYRYEPSWNIPARKRTGASHSLTAGQREIGYIDNYDAINEWSPRFRSLLEQGVCDVRKLYSSHYLEQYDRKQLRLDIL